MGAHKLNSNGGGYDKCFFNLEYPFILYSHDFLFKNVNGRGLSTPAPLMGALDTY